ncbi:MAG: hypothetical protein Hens2KO_21260 [Henriciella sp.]
MGSEGHGGSGDHAGDSQTGAFHLVRLPFILRVRSLSLANKALDWPQTRHFDLTCVRRARIQSCPVQVQDLPKRAVELWL